MHTVQHTAIYINMATLHVFGPNGGLFLLGKMMLNRLSLSLKNSSTAISDTFDRRNVVRMFCVCLCVCIFGVCVSARACA